MDYPNVEPKALLLKKSNIPDAGKGLYTNEFIEKDKIILEYKGYISNTENLTSSESDVAVDVGCGVSIVGSSLAAYINDNIIYQKVYKNQIEQLYSPEYISNWDKVFPRWDFSYNCKFVIIGKGEYARIYIETIRDIQSGEELFIDYGARYWLCRFRTDKNNQKILSEKKSSILGYQLIKN